MKNAIKIISGVALVGAAGITSYMMLNKKTRKKASQLADAMVKETTKMMK